MRQVVLLLLIMLTPIARAGICAALVADANDGNSVFISYLEALLEKGIIQNSALQNLVQNIEGSEAIQNPLANLSTASRIHAHEIENYLRDPNLDRAALLEWARVKLYENQHSQSERSSAQQKTLRREMKFVRVTGEFRGYDLEVMEAPVTQAMWVELMGVNPSFHKDGGKTQDDHPVENITWFEAAVFANRVSERAGLKPYYKFGKRIPRKMKGRPEEEGYRFPHYAEMEPLMRVPAETLLSRYIDRTLYAWGASNSGGRTHPVADLLPLRIPPVQVFDLFGNVHEWTNDWTKFPDDDAWYAYITGGSFASTALILNKFAPVTEPDKHIGFRLVRKRRKSE